MWHDVCQITERSHDTGKGYIPNASRNKWLITWIWSYKKGLQCLRDPLWREWSSSPVSECTAPTISYTIYLVTSLQVHWGPLRYVKCKALVSMTHRKYAPSHLKRKRHLLSTHFKMSCLSWPSGFLKKSLVTQITQNEARLVSALSSRRM